METIEFVGQISQGRGIGKKIMKNLTVFFESKNLKVFPGTLNVVFFEPIFLDPNKATFNYKEEFYFWKISINGINCYAYRWPHCPLHIIEIVSEINLKTKTNIETNTIVKVEIKKNLLKKVNLLDFILWNIAWKKRERIYYSNDFYTQKVIGKFLNLPFKIKKKLNFKN